MNTPIPLPPKPGETMPVPRPASEEDALLLLIERVARDPSVDLERMKQLFELRREVRADAAKTAYYEALAQVQGKLPAIVKFGKAQVGDKFRTYAKLEDLIEAIKPILAPHGFSIQSELTYPAEGKICVTTVLAKGAHANKTPVILPYDTSGAKNATQSVGSSISYGRRYGILAQLNISVVDEDDDAQGAGAAVSNEQVAELEQLITQTGGEVAAYCKSFKVESLGNLNPVRFATVKGQLLERKRAQHRDNPPTDR